jgi:transposase
MTERDGSVVQDLVVGHKANGRCVYSRAGKRALVEQALRPGVSTARLAMTHGVNANLLRKWIRAYQTTQDAPRDLAMPALLPVLTPPTMPSVASASSLEIMIGGATIRLSGAVDAQQLRTVMDCLLHRR